MTPLSIDKATEASTPSGPPPLPKKNKPSEEKVTGKPADKAPESAKSDDKAAAKSSAKDIVKPTEDKTSTKPNDKDVVKPTEDKTSAKPGDKDVVKPAEDKVSAKSNDKDVVKPTEDKASAKPVGEKASTKPEDKTSTPTKSDGKDVSKPTGDKSTVDGPILKPTQVSSQESKSDDKPEKPKTKRLEPPVLPIKDSVRIVSETDPSKIVSPDHQPFLIQTRGLVKQYGGRRVVNGVDIYVKPGEVVGLLGKNGAGKTTTFYMIVGLVPPNEGHVFMGDEDVTHMPMYRRARRGIGYLPQEESIFRKLTVEENLLAILETLPLTEDERDARCDQLLKDFGIEHVRESIAITLSGGEKRRVTIARALVTSPSLLLLDEPFAGVDPMAVHDIQEIILQLKERGLGVLVTDHSVRETLSVVDRAYIIDEGRVLSEGSREFLLNDPVAREIYLGHRFSM